MTVAYYDTTHLLKLQMAEDGTPEVRAHAEKVFEARAGDAVAFIAAAIETESAIDFVSGDGADFLGA